MNDYPTDEEIEMVKTWKFDQPGTFELFMDYVKSIGNYWPTESFGWRRDGRTVHVSTGGWSGNEDILAAMQDNVIFWSVCWETHGQG